MVGGVPRCRNFSHDANVQKEVGAVRWREVVPFHPVAGVGRRLDVAVVVAAWW